MLPNAQYQWKVLLFGLKVALSLFQKTMIRIFEPILHNVLIYNILLFSKNEVVHKKLMGQFIDITCQYEITLLETKSQLG